MAAVVERSDHEPRIHRRRASELYDSAGVRQPAVQPRGAGLARQHECTGREHGMCRIDGAAPREDRHLRRLGPAELPAKLGVAVRSRWVDPLRPPRAAGRGAQHARADQDDVSECSKQAHQEAVRVAVRGDQVVRARNAGYRDHTVERGHEVRVEARLLEAEVAGVQAVELGRELDLGQRLDVQDLSVTERLRDAVGRCRVLGRCTSAIWTLLRPCLAASSRATGIMKRLPAVGHRRMILRPARCDASSRGARCASSSSGHRRDRIDLRALERDDRLELAAARADRRCDRGQARLALTDCLCIAALANILDLARERSRVGDRARRVGPERPSGSSRPENASITFPAEVACAIDGRPSLETGWTWWRPARSRP